MAQARASAARAAARPGSPAEAFPIPASAATLPAPTMNISPTQMTASLTVNPSWERRSFALILMQWPVPHHPIHTDRTGFEEMEIAAR